ncbi:MAG: hypothetical protein CM15mP102_06550 [Flavobacteriales bacterium]|nr:MAG: hypothetical protein CM15mP102_06550 [Flavobacteriales bacterium]
MLKDYGDGTIKIDQDELETNKNKIVDTLKTIILELSKLKQQLAQQLLYMK